VPELELDGVSEHTQETFFLLLLDDFDALAFVATDAAEVKGLAALTLHHMNASVAHDLGTVRAFEGDLPVGMPDTIKFAVFLNGLGRENHRRLDVRDGDGGVNGFDEQLHVAQF